MCLPQQCKKNFLWSRLQLNFILPKCLSAKESTFWRHSTFSSVCAYVPWQWYLYGKYFKSTIHWIVVSKEAWEQLQIIQQWLFVSPTETTWLTENNSPFQSTKHGENINPLKQDTKICWKLGQIHLQQSHWQKLIQHTKEDAFTWLQVQLTLTLIASKS